MCPRLSSRRVLVASAWTRFVNLGTPAMGLLVILLGLVIGRSSPATGQEKSPAKTSKATDEAARKPAEKSASTAAEKPAAEKPAAEKPVEFKYLRVGRGEKGVPTTLETATARFVTAEAGKPQVVVDLIGVIHIGDRGYYDKLNESFEQYDALLYELVAPEGTKVPLGGRKEGGGHPVSSLQKGMKSMLDLEFQLDCIDYTKANFVHADMTPEEMAKSMSDKNESWMQMIFRMLGQGMAQQGKQNQRGGDLQLLAALFAKDRPLRLKRIMAEQFEDMDASMAALEGADGSTLIAERNKKALAVLQRELKSGKKRIGIFYGAGHMADMEKRLVTEFGLKRAEEKWFSAWTMAAP